MLQSAGTLQHGKYQIHKEYKMADLVLKDNKGRKIGTISTASNGVQTIKDEKGRIVGTGNLLTNLL